MRAITVLLIALGVGGCATQHQAARVPTPPAVGAPLVREAAPTRIVETRYEMRGYRDAETPAVRHEAHAVYRSTRLPARSGDSSNVAVALETMPREKFPPASFAPLPSSAELAAELAAQRQITGDLRTIKAAMTTIEKQAQDQYGTLVGQTAETIKLRQQLEQERMRVKELQSKLRDDAPTSAAVAVSQPGETPNARW